MVWALSWCAAVLRSLCRGWLEKVQCQSPTLCLWRLMWQQGLVRIKGISRAILYSHSTHFLLVTLWYLLQSVGLICTENCIFVWNNLWLQSEFYCHLWSCGLLLSFCSMRHIPFTLSSLAWLCLMTWTILNQGAVLRFLPSLESVGEASCDPVTALIQCAPEVFASAARSVLAELTQNRIRRFFHLPPEGARWLSSCNPRDPTQGWCFTWGCCVEAVAVNTAMKCESRAAVIECVVERCVFYTAEFGALPRQDLEQEFSLNWAWQTSGRVEDKESKGLPLGRLVACYIPF